MKFELMKSYLFSTYKYRNLIKNLVLRDLKNYYSASILGLLWSMIMPLVMMTVYYFAFKYILNFRTPNFLLMLLVGIMHLNFFNAAAMASTDAIVGSPDLIKKVYFPRIVLPLASVCYSFVVFLFSIFVFVPIAIFLGSKPGLYFLSWLIILPLHFVFTFGVCMALSSLTVFFRDIKHFMEILIMMLFWLSPILWDYQKIPENLKKFMLINPLNSYMVAYQDIIYRNTYPDISIVILCAAWAIVSLIAGLLIFNHIDPKFAEVV